MTKKCSKCGIEKPLSEFDRNNCKATGYRSECKSCRKEYRKRNEKKLLAQKAEYRKNNPEKLKLYFRRRYSTDIHFKLSILLRRQLRDALKGNYKKSSAIDLLGCSIEEFKKHISDQFKPGMTWDKHNLYGWHIDHIRPCALFDLTNPEEQKTCFHFTNLQPLWAIDNMKKGAKLEYA